MADCPSLQTCPHFAAMSDASADASLLARYCRGAFSRCARFQLEKAGFGACLPKDLLPDEAARALQILKEQRARSAL